MGSLNQFALKVGIFLSLCLLMILNIVLSEPLCWDCGGELGKKFSRFIIIQLSCIFFLIGTSALITFDIIMFVVNLIYYGYKQVIRNEKFIYDSSNYNEKINAWAVQRINENAAKSRASLNIN